MWVAAKALGVSPFSDTFAKLSETQVIWAIANYYKDQEEDLEKYKLVCRFINPQAASEIWDQKSAVPVDEIDPREAAVLEEILTHSKSGISAQELQKRLKNPEQFGTPVETLDKIEVVR